jgi:hypothetical protein
MIRYYKLNKNKNIGYNLLYITLILNSIFREYNNSIYYNIINYDLYSWYFICLIYINIDSIFII